MDNKNNNNNNNNNNNISNNNDDDNDNISQYSSPTRSREEHEINVQQRRQRNHILLMSSNKMLKRCCCYMLILCLAILLPRILATTTATAGIKTTESMLTITTDAPPPPPPPSSSSSLSKQRLTNSAEILKLPHAFRHEEHYSHRIEQAVNDYKRSQSQQSKERDKNLTTETTTTLTRTATKSPYIGGNKNEFPDWPLEPHHRRHEQHYLLQQNAAHQPEHHLRHSSSLYRHHSVVPLPPMRHQRQHQLQQHQPQISIVKNELEPHFAETMPKTHNHNSQRFTLHLKANHFDESDVYDDDDDNDDDNNDDDSSSSNDNNNKSDVNDDSNSNSDDDSDDDDDYSYESDSVESRFGNAFPRSSNSYSNIDGKAASVKRYTHGLRNLKPSIGSAKKNWNFFDEQKMQHKTLKNNERMRSGIGIDDNNDNESSDDDFPSFTNEKWRKIELEHHKRQMEHRHEMQALRLRHKPSVTNNILQHEHSPKNEDPNETDSIFSRNYIPGTVTRQKIEELGTADAALESRRAHVAKHKKNRDLANAHVKQIISEAACRIPQRRVERIQLDPAKIYTPHCTILHRCADDTGCCRNERQTCAPKSTKSVDLYFFVKDINENRPTIERRTFINHTECHCVDRSQHKADEYHDNNLNNSPEITARRATILDCNCPKLFEKILQEDGYCRCDCSSGNTGCDSLKRGMEHFSMIDRKCIADGRCKPPTCENGTYLKKRGRCPRREEQLVYTVGGSSSSDAHTFH